jgi:flagellar motor switch protein FliN/FliY
VEAQVPDFAELAPAAAAAANSLDHLMEVSCTVTAELGRTHLSIAEVLKLGVGSVVELDRMLSQPVDVLVQGVLLARGEVVVVNDQFAVRIKEIVEPRKRA